MRTSACAGGGRVGEGRSSQATAPSPRRLHCFSESLDNHRSIVYSAYGAAASRSGVGMANNNRPYMNSTSTITGGLGGAETQISYAAKQNNGVVHTALQQQISCYVGISGTFTGNNIVPTICHKLI
jgi:hypothetical protein